MKPWLWIVSIATLGVIDAYCAYVKHEGTLSEAARATFKTHTKAGKVCWTGGWVSLSWWLIPHINKGIQKIS